MLHTTIYGFAPDNTTEKIILQWYPARKSLVAFCASLALCIPSTDHLVAFSQEELPAPPQNSPLKPPLFCLF